MTDASLEFRADVQAALSRYLSWSEGLRDAALPLAEEALAFARRSKDREAIALSLSIFVECLSGTLRASDCVAVLEEAKREGVLELQEDWGLSLQRSLLELGRRHEAQTESASSGDAPARFVKATKS